MSHYAVLVIHNENQNFDKLLAPYSENLEVEPYLEYKHDDALKALRDEYGYEEEEIDDTLLESFVKEYSSYSLKDGDVYTTYNPNSKWDWYSIGGRFSDKLELTDEGIEEAIKQYNHGWFGQASKEEQIEYVKDTDSAPIKYIKWHTTLSQEEKDELRRWWEINVEGDELRDGEEKDEYFFWNPDWFRRRYKDADTYIKTEEMTTFFAVLTPDGEWHEPSKMGWFACTDGEPEDELKWDLEFYDRFIKPNLDSDLICTVVDCHI